MIATKMMKIFPFNKGRKGKEMSKIKMKLIKKLLKSGLVHKQDQLLVELEKLSDKPNQVQLHIIDALRYIMEHHFKGATDEK